MGLHCAIENNLFLKVVFFYHFHIFPYNPAVNIKLLPSIVVWISVLAVPDEGTFRKALRTHLINL